MTEWLKSIFKGLLTTLSLKKVKDFWSILEIEFPEATYASTSHVLHFA